MGGLQLRGGGRHPARDRPEYCAHFGFQHFRVLLAARTRDPRQWRSCSLCVFWRFKHFILYFSETLATSGQVVSGLMSAMAGCEYPASVSWARELELCRASVRHTGSRVGPGLDSSHRMASIIIHDIRKNCHDTFSTSRGLIKHR